MYKGKSINSTNKNTYDRCIANLNAANITKNNRPDPYKMIQQYQKNNSKPSNLSNLPQNNNAVNFQQSNSVSNFVQNNRPINVQIKNSFNQQNELQDDFFDNVAFQFRQGIKKKSQTQSKTQSIKFNFELETKPRQNNLQGQSNSYWGNLKKPSNPSNLQINRSNNQKEKQKQQASLEQFQYQNQNPWKNNNQGMKIKQLKQKKEPVKMKNQAYLQQYTYNQNVVTLDSLQAKKGPTIKNYISANNRQWDSYQTKQINDNILIQSLRNFGHIKMFKNNQKGIIKCALTGKDVFVCMPTGGGKSLTFQILTFIKKGIYVCILPLISLIFDQQIQAQQFGIQAYSLTGKAELTKYIMIANKLRNYTEGDKSILIFCTPQKIGLSQNFIEILQNVYERGFLSRIIIDEVHCVSTWGKQFRKEYQNLSNLKIKFPNAPILALTATVTQSLKQQVIKRLKINKCYFFQSSFNRPNLFYQVRPKDRKTLLNDICNIIDSHYNKSGIIYCITKKQCEQTCQYLKNKGYLIQYYHADVNEDYKRQIQQKWMKNEINIIVATIAFGMGINKPDVRYVIHHSLSKSLENYYQQSGRAGRDGEIATCILFYLRSDKQSLQSLNLKNQNSTNQVKNFSNRQLAQMIKYCEQKFLCRRKFQLMYLGQKDFDSNLCKKTCDNCLKDKKFKEYQCIKHAKQLIKALKYTTQSRQRVTRNQIISVCRGKVQKNKKINVNNLEQLQQCFIGWTIDNIEQLIIQFISFQVLIQAVWQTKVSKDKVVNNVYLQCNLKSVNTFLSQVQSLALRRDLKSVRQQQQSTYTQLQNQQVPNSNSEDEEVDFLIQQAIMQRHQKKKQQLAAIIESILDE